MFHSFPYFPILLRYERHGMVARRADSIFGEHINFSGSLEFIKPGANVAVHILQMLQLLFISVAFRQFLLMAEDVEGQEEQQLLLKEFIQTVLLLLYEETRPQMGKKRRFGHGKDIERHKNGDLCLALAAREEHFEHAPSGILAEQYGRH